MRRLLATLGVIVGLAGGCSDDSSQVGVDDSASSTAASTVASSSTTAPGSSSAPDFPGVMVFVDGRVLDLEKGEPRLVAEFPDASAPDSPPVATGFGVLAAVGEPGKTRLMLVGRDGERQDLASGVAGFAVSADGKRVTWSALQGSPGAGDSLLVEVDLANRRTLHRLRHPGFARVVGYAGPAVLLATGDGAAATAASWTASRHQVVRLDGYGSVAATSPDGGTAALNEGDGLCPRVVKVAPAGTVTPVMDGPCRQNGPFVAGSFNLGASTFVTPTDDRIAIVYPEDRTTQSGWPIDGVLLAVGWGAEVEVVVLTDKEGQLVVTVCSAAEGDCQVAATMPAPKTAPWVVDHTDPG